MKKPDLSKFAKSVQALAVKHSPEILTGIGIAGMVTTTIMAVKATPKALELIQDAKYEKGEELTAVEKTKACWKCYIPAVTTGIVSSACIIGAHSVNMKRNAALATAYSLSETALKEYQEKVVETIGEKKEEVIRDKVAKEHIDKNPVRNSEVFITEKGSTLFYDPISGRYFESDIEKIKRIVNELNAQMINEMYIPLNDLYYEIGLKTTDMGDEIGWNLNRDGLIEVKYSAQKAEDERPCLVMEYRVGPRYDYAKLM